LRTALHKINSIILLNIAIIFFLSNLVYAQTADYNEVGKRVAIMLQNRHFSDIPFDANTSGQFLEEYLLSLDSDKVFFSMEDVKGFHVEHGGSLHSAIFQGNSIKVANNIYKVFLKKATERISYIKNLIDERKLYNNLKSEMVFEKTKTWAADEQKAKSKWELFISNLLIGEVLKISKKNDDINSLIEIAQNNVVQKYEQYLEKLEKNDEEEIANLFLSAIARVYDPHSDFMTSNEMDSFKDSMSNQLVGIGAMLKPHEDGSIRVVGIVVGGPADLSKELQINDTIIGIDTNASGNAEDMINVIFMDLASVINLIRGQENTSVAIKVKLNEKSAEKYKVIIIHRGKVSLKEDKARGELIHMRMDQESSYRLGIITLPSFYSDFDEGKIRCSDDVQEIILKLLEEKIDGLIFDLRDNGGGVLEEARRMAGFFLESGPVVQVKDALGRIQVKETDNKRPLYSGPMIVLVSKSSASASEILAGALQDYNRALIVGDTSTFGKGTVQSPMDIGRELPLFASREKAGSMKITIQKFYRPSGSSTQIDGVEADIVFPSSNDEIEIGEKFLRHALPHDRIKPASNLKSLDEEKLFITKLKEKSQIRITNSQDFKYLVQDIEKLNSFQKNNHCSLNLVKRMHDFEEQQKSLDQRQKEKIKRFRDTEIKDKKYFNLFKFVSDSNELTIKSVESFNDNEEYVRRSVDDAQKNDIVSEWPSGIDPQKRESLSILSDLINLTEHSKLAELIK
jgi:carboxyl-terminal processing protease